VTTMRRTSLLCVAVLLAATTAAADTVITAEEVIPCSVVAVDTSFVRIKLPQGGVRVFDTHDVVELRLSDSCRFPDLATQLPPAEVMPDSALPPQPSPASDSSLPVRPGVIDTLPRKVSPPAMAVKCRDMKVVLRECGRRNDTVFDLFRHIDKEQKALSRIWPEVETYSGIYVTVAGLAGCGVGSLIAFAANPCGASPAGPVVGCLAGSISGAALAVRWGGKLLADHRGRVNDLVGRTNRAVAPSP
jgi:hypothetical protein